MDVPREFKFDFTVEDCVRFNLDHGARTGGVPRGTLTLCGLITVTVLAAMLGNALRSPSPTAALSDSWPVFLFAILFWLLILRGRSGRVRKAIDRLVKNPDGGDRMIGPRRLVVDPAGVRQELDAEVLELEWRAFTRVVRGPDHLYLYFSPIQAIVLPRRCFPSEGDFDAFAALVEKRVASERPMKVA